MKIVVIALLAILAGCATAPRPVDQLSIYDVCAVTLYGQGQRRSDAEYEAQRRGVDCTAYYPAIIAREQQRDQSTMDAANYFLRRSTPPPVTPTTTCRTYPTGGGTYRTVCN